MPANPRIASFHSAGALAGHLRNLGWPFPIDEAILAAPASPLAQPLEVSWLSGRRRIGNRFASQPMEGWDGETDGRPSELTRRRWLRFGRGGAKLIWGGEAVAVLPEARANPNQLLLTSGTAASFETLRREAVKAHEERFGGSDDLVIGLQLTHSGRFCRPREKNRLQPVIAYRHPLLDARLPASGGTEPISDCEVARIVNAFGEAARLARETGFDFVDLKHCHGYLGHEFLSALHRAGPYGGAFENRTRFLHELVSAVRDRAPGLEIGVRFSAYDSIPFERDPTTGLGRPCAVNGTHPYTWAFGADPAHPTQPDLTEAKALVRLIASLGIHLVNVTASSPYYAPHLSRPALFPPSDGYLPPEDPAAGAARLLDAARQLKAAEPGLVYVSTGWSYFQNFLPHLAQAVVREGWTDLVGLGRMMLAYPDLAADVLEKGQIDTKRLCRTFSDCTTGPRNGLVSGCYPLDPFYKSRPEATEVRKIKLRMRQPE